MCFFGTCMKVKEMSKITEALYARINERESENVILRHRKWELEQEAADYVNRIQELVKQNEGLKEALRKHNASYLCYKQCEDGSTKTEWMFRRYEDGKAVDKNSSQMIKELDSRLEKIEDHLDIYASGWRDK